MKLIHLTDTHLVAPGELLYEIDPLARLEACIADINEKHADAELCVITGDLADDGEPAAYEALRGALDRLTVPTRLVLGNHDIRENFLAAFPETPVDDQGYVQDAFDTGAGRFLILDTNQPGTHAGFYCEARQAWLADQLEAAGEAPLFILMHHPPFPVHLAPLDVIGLMQAEPFERLVAPRASQIRHLFYGHVHRPIAGSWLGIPCSTIRATAHQVLLDFQAAERIPGCEEPPAYAVVFIDPKSVVIHVHDYLDRSRRFQLGPPDYEAWHAQRARTG